MGYEVISDGIGEMCAVIDPNGEIEYDALDCREVAELIAEVLNEADAPEEMAWDDVEAVLDAKARRLRTLLERFGK